MEGGREVGREGLMDYRYHSSIKREGGWKEGRERERLRGRGEGERKGWINGIHVGLYPSSMKR